MDAPEEARISAQLEQWLRSDRKNLSLGVLLGDIVVAGVGGAIGIIGIALVVGLGAVITKLV